MAQRPIPFPDSPHPDWLLNRLTITGPIDKVALLAKAARGAGGIPWIIQDEGEREEDRIMALVNPPDGSPGLILSSARILARQLRTAEASHQANVVQAAGRGGASPFDLHALLPVPQSILRKGPDDAGSTTWLRSEWGTTRALRHVRLLDGKADGRKRRTARLHYDFFSADWSPWQALMALRLQWAGLIFDLAPSYDQA